MKITQDNMIGVVILMLICYVLYQSCVEHFDFDKQLFKNTSDVDYTLRNEKENGEHYDNMNLADERESKIIYDNKCGSKDVNFLSSNLLPKSNVTLNNDGFDLAPKNLQNVNFLNATDKIGVDTISSSLRNANYQIRPEPPNPKKVVSPWLNNTIDPDPLRRPLN